MSMCPEFPAMRPPLQGRHPVATFVAIALAATIAFALLAADPAVAAPAAAPDAASAARPASAASASASASGSAASTSASASAAASAASASSAASAPTCTKNGAPCECSLRNDANCEAGDRFLPIALGTLLYLVIVVTARWQKVAYPTRRLLDAEIEAVLARIAIIKAGGGTGGAVLAPIESMLASARRLAGFNPPPGAAPGGAGPGKWQRLLDRLYWSRGGEIAAWGLLHEAEEQLVRFQPPEELRAGLERAAAQLRDVDGSVAAPLADRIEHELQHAVVDLRDPACALLGTLLDLTKPVDGDLLRAVSTATAQTAPALAPQALALLAAIPASLADEIRTFLASPPATASGAAVPATATAFRLLLAEAQSLLAAAAAPRDALRAAGTDAAALTAALALADVAYLRPAATLAARLQAALDARARWPIERWRALLVEGQALLYDRGDTDFARLVSWQNKAVWLVTCGLLLMVGLGTALGHLALFLIGAAGGLMSRLSRALHRQDVLTDYGASWSPLFLSPVVGAIAGWSGLLIAAVLHQFGILGTLFDPLQWNADLTPLALGLAFVLGFSERAFDSLLGAIDDKLVVPPPAGTATPAAAPAALAIATTALPDARTGQHYEARLEASGGTAPYQWTVTAGKPPAGLAVSGTSIAGTPDAAAAGATASFTVQVTDAKGKTASRAFTITVARATT
jgi:hypothetical protein